MKEALYWKAETGDKVRCQLCPRACLLAVDQTGFCGVRRNVDGHLLALTFGKVASVAIDPIEKKPLYHFYPGAPTLSLGGVGCNLRCLHCQNSSISHRDAVVDDATLRDLSPGDVVATAREHDCRIIVWTYNEPGIWIEYILETGHLARKAGMQTVLVTAGVLEHEPLRDLLTVVDAYRLDVKGFSGDLYRRLTGADFLVNVLENALIAKEMGCHLEIVTNVIPNWNDDEEQLSGISLWIAENLGPEVPWHVTAYYPAYKLSEPATPVASLDRAREIGVQNGLKHIFVGNVAGHPAQHTHCPACGELLIPRRGYSLGKVRIHGGKCDACGYTLQNYRDDR